MSILAHIMAEQEAKGRGAIKTAPSNEYLRLVKQILSILESHDIGNKVQEKKTIHPEFEGRKWVTQTGTPLELADSTPASTSTCATTNASVDTFGNRCYCNVDHFRRGCFYNEGNSGGSNLSDDK